MPVSRTCTFCGNDIEPGTGKMYVRRDGNVHFFCSGKCQKNQLDLGRVGRKIRWTRRYVREAQQRAAPPQAAVAVEVVPEEAAEVAEADAEALPVEETVPVEEGTAPPDRADVLEAFTGLPGVGPATAEALWEAGFTSMETLRTATEEDLAGVKGLGPASAKKIAAHLREAP